jgi:hypothetical protein
MRVTFGSGFSMVWYPYDWAGWKAALARKGGVPQFSAADGEYLVYFYDGPEVHLVSMFQGAVPEGELPLYAQAKNDADKADFEATIQPVANASIAPKDPGGRPRMSVEKPAQSRVTLFSHDWTNSTTWYTTSLFVAGEVAVDQGAHTDYALANKNVIDSFHGKLSGEDFLKDREGRSYRVTVKVNGAAKVEQDPHDGTGGDFTVDYAAGVLHFLAPLAPLAPTDVVTVDYHRAVDSTFIVAPIAGKILSIDSAEVQFSTDIGITDSVVFQPYGLVDAFAPQLVQAGMVPSGTKIPLGDPVVYKTIGDFQNDAWKSYPVYPPIGGPSWRGMTEPMIILDWDYQGATVLSSAGGMEIRIKLQHDKPFTGTFATATFYCISEDV